MSNELYELPITIHDLPSVDSEYQARLKLLEQILTDNGFRYSEGIGEYQDDEVQNRSSAVPM